MTFTQELVSATSVDELTADRGVVTVYPMPVQNGLANLVLDVPGAAAGRHRARLWVAAWCGRNASAGWTAWCSAPSTWQERPQAYVMRLQAAVSVAACAWWWSPGPFDGAFPRVASILICAASGAAQVRNGGTRWRNGEVVLTPRLLASAG